MSTYQAQSLKGLRSKQQDYFNVKKHSNNEWTLVVADGLGGEPDGEHASKDAVESILKSNPQTSEEIVKAFYQAHDDVWASSRGATTLVVALIKENKAYICSVGDSRAYLIREGKIKQLTEDDNLFGKKVMRHKDDDPKPSWIDDPFSFPHLRCRLTSFIGGDRRTPTIKPTCMEYDLKDGDRLVLATDGLWDVWNNETLLEKMKDCDFSAKMICSEAINSGSTDNTTAIIFNYEHSHS